MSHLRPAAMSDAAAIAAVYAPYVRDTAISFEAEPPGEQEMAARISAAGHVYPWFVAEDDSAAEDGSLLGYAYAGQHRTRAAYRWTVEVSVYLRPEAQGRGLGRALYALLLETLTRQGFVQAYSGIVLPNEASVALHEAMGFEPIGVYRKNGYKLGRWHDVGWWGRELATPTEPPAEPAGVLDLPRQT
jgi:L-amino acid N-acyltransferase YncA